MSIFTHTFAMTPILARKTMQEAQDVEVRVQTESPVRRLGMDQKSIGHTHTQTEDI